MLKECFGELLKLVLEIFSPHPKPKDEAKHVELTLRSLLRAKSAQKPFQLWQVQQREEFFPCNLI